MSIPGVPPGTDLSKIPMMPNPSGAPPNFVNPPSQASVMMGVGFPLVIISAAFLVLRLVSNFRNTGNRKLVCDDYLCIAGYVCLTAYFALGMSMRNVDHHSWDIPLSVFDESFAKKIFFFNFLASPAMNLPKIAILCLYMRIFKTQKLAQIISWIAIIVCIMVSISQMSVAAAACSPVHGVWGLRDECGSWTATASIPAGAVAIVIDITLFCLPHPIIWNLHLDPRKKFGLCLVFMAGIFAIIASAISLYYKVKVHLAADKLWIGPVVQATSFAEGYTTIIVGCTPAIYSLWTNQVVKSALYSSIRSSFMSATSSQTSSKHASGWYTSDKSSLSDSDKSSLEKSPMERSSAERFQMADDYHRTLLPVSRDFTKDDLLSPTPVYHSGITRSTTISQHSMSKDF